jgi:hypothetical protein
VSARTSAAVYETDEPARDQLGLGLLRYPPPPLPAAEEYDGE